ncbi:MAG: hypothetical protein Q4C95_06555 [Planctomycetia bacterium]|nr:hypothetical protein [Planctomycetia bacterium]
MLKVIFEFLGGPSQRSVWIQLGVLTFFFLVGWNLWKSIHLQIENSLDYQIGLKDIQIVSPPQWLAPTFVKEAFESRPRFLNKPLNILAPDILERLALAFESHPFVNRVESIRIQYPPRVLVKLQFRNPVAFVVIPTLNSGLNSRIYMIDEDGYYLSVYEGDSLTIPKHFQNCSIIRGIKSVPISPIGEYWGDPLIYESAALASFLMKEQEALQIKNINVQLNELERIGGIYNLMTTAGTQIHWGTFPLNERLDYYKLEQTDSKAQAIREEVAEKQRLKLEYLKKLAEKYGSLDSVPLDQLPIDLSNL